MVRFAGLEAFADRATKLLVALASDPDPALERAYDELLFEVLHDVIRRRGSSLALRAVEGQGGGWLPAVQPADLDAVAVDATVAALERARRTAHRFDPQRGDGASWALGAAGFAYVDVVREFYQSRRKGTSVSVDPADLNELSNERRSADSPEHVAEVRAALLEALDQLEAEERFAVLAQAQYGMSYGEISSYLFGGPGETKRVDRLLQRARQKLTRAERAWNGS